MNKARHEAELFKEQRFHADEILRALVEDTASTTGEDFFYSLVRSLAKALRVRYAFVADCQDSQRDRVRTLAFWTGDRFIENVEYSAQGTICERVVRDGVICHYPEGARLIFPGERALADMGVESYLGIPFFDSAGNLLGYIAVLDTRPMPEEATILWILKIFAARAGAELERKRSDQQHAQALAEERRRLARDLHDSVVQSWYSISLFAEAARRSAENGDQNDLERNLTRLLDSSQQSLREMRRMVHELRPSVLEQEGLIRALQQRLEAVEGCIEMKAQLFVEGEIDLPFSIETHLYRIAQEALNNVLKHAQATEVIVQLRGGHKWAALSIKDNGRGFDLQDVGGQGQIGLNNIRERADQLGAQLRIASSPNQGTAVEVHVECEGSSSLLQAW